MSEILMNHTEILIIGILVVAATKGDIHLVFRAVINSMVQ